MGSTETEISGWEAAYRNRPTEWYRKRDSYHEDCGRLHDVFQQVNVTRILDLGCGDGRQLVYFARRGYEMCGLDVSPTGIELAEKWLADEGFAAELVASDMTKIPWPDEFFDAIVCVQVINHHRIREIRQTISEIHRVLRPGGYLFLTVQTSLPIPGVRATCSSKRVIEIEPKTFVPVEGHEKGVPHHDFDLDELLREFGRFKPWEIHKDVKDYTCVLWQKRGLG